MIYLNNIISLNTFNVVVCFIISIWRCIKTSIKILKINIFLCRQEQIEGNNITKMHQSS